MVVETNSGQDSALLEGVEVQLVFLPPQGGHIDVVEAVQADRSVKPLRPDVVYDDSEALWSPQPILHRQKLRVGRLTGDVLHNGGHVFRRLCGAHDMVEQPRTVRLREKDGAVIFVLFRGHLQGVVGQLVMSVMVGIDGECIWAGPVFPVDDRVQNPGGVGPVMDGEVTHLLRAHIGSKVEHLSWKKKHHISHIGLWYIYTADDV